MGKLSYSVPFAWASRSIGAFAVLIGLLVGQESAWAGGQQPVDPRNPPEGRFSDDWAEVYMAGKKIGYSHSSMGREGDRVRTSTRMHFEMGRADQPIAIEVTQSTVETLDGKPLEFASIMDMSLARNETRGVIRDGKVTLTSAQFGVESKETHNFPEGAMMTWGLFRESLLRGFEPGTQYTVRMYAPELRSDAATEAQTVVGEVETFDHRGQEHRGQKVTMRVDSPLGRLEMLSWVDEHGVPIKMVIPATGLGELELVVTDEKTALADFVPPELFMKTTIKADRKIDRQSAQRIRYKVFSTSPAKLEPLPDTGSQSVKVLSDQDLELTVKRQPHRPAGGSGELSPAEKTEFLSGNLMINLDDPELKKLAARAAGDETDPFKLADRLRQFVTDFVEEKSLNVGFATASEVARTREGDCSEHAVLLTALGRLNGIPSRVVVGLAYVPFFGRQDDIFGYHMWTQFYIDGRWLDIDAALRETECSPIRIAFATSSLKNSGLAELSLPLLNRIGAIDIDILEIEE